MAALIDRLDPSRWTHLVLWTVRDAAPTNAFYVSLGMVRDGAQVTLDDGSRLHVDLVIGADGLHSIVRELAFGPVTLFFTFATDRVDKIS
jgi:2-polyprenyl-6-methoxyphenol hydroxylase-like FAD-dependent oxidoreductase